MTYANPFRWRARPRLSLWLPLVFSLLQPPSFAQTRPPKDPAPSTPQNWEQWRESVPVAGGVRVGVMSDPGPSFSPTQFTVWLPKDYKASAVCAEIISQDGRYVASAYYDIRGEAPGALRLNLPRSQHFSKVRDLTSRNVAILARLAERCATVPEKPGDYLVAAWNAEKLSTDVEVLVNSRLQTSIVAIEAGKVVAEFACGEADGTATAFTLRCRVPAREIKLPRTFSIQMSRGGSVNNVSLPLGPPE